MDDSQANANRTDQHSGAASSPPPPSSESAALGIAYLLDVFENDGPAVADLLNAALRSIRTDVDRLERAAATGNAAAAVEASHRIKGTCGSIRALRLLALASSIESASRAQPPNVAEAQLAALREAVGIVAAQVHIQSQLLRTRRDPAELQA